MEGQDCVFGDALNSIEENIKEQDAKEASMKTKANDPLKVGKPVDLSKEGEKDNKLKKMEGKVNEKSLDSMSDEELMDYIDGYERSLEDENQSNRDQALSNISRAKEILKSRGFMVEGIDPYSDKKGDYNQDEKNKIDKLTEKETNVAEDVKAMITKAKEALDAGNYDEAQNLVTRLSQVKAAVSEPEKVEPGNTGMDMPPVEEEMEESTEDEVHEKFIMDDKLQEMIDKALDEGAGFSKVEEGKKNPKAKTRNRGDVIFPAESPKVTDDKDHFPMNTEKQARNALAQANKYKEAPKWYKGSLADLTKKVASAVQKKYKDIEVTKKASTPGKG